MNHLDRIRGALYGHLCGDALGVPYEFKAASALPATILWTGHGSHGQAPGTFSDDGSLMLCSTLSLSERGSFDATDMGRRFLRWWREGYLAAGGEAFDIGGATTRALLRIEQGVPALEAGPSESRDNGNGSLMRILPMSLFGLGLSLGEQADLAHRASRITHGHVRSQVCCALHSALVARLWAGDARETAFAAACADLRRLYAAGEAFAEELAHVETFEKRGGSGYVVDCLRCAWDAVRDAGSYEEAVVRAVRYGNDTDTTAAVAGGLAGFVFGIDGVPQAWRDALRLEGWQRVALEEAALALAARTGTGNASTLAAERLEFIA